MLSCYVSIMRASVSGGGGELFTLLHAEPWLLVLDFFHDSGARSSVVSTSWLLVGVEDFGEDEDVRGSSEGIWEDSNRPRIS